MPEALLLLPVRQQVLPETANSIDSMFSPPSSNPTGTAPRLSNNFWGRQEYSTMPVRDKHLLWTLVYIRLRARQQGTIVSSIYRRILRQ